MTILIAGASGASGKRLLAELLNRGHDVRVIVRSPDRLPDAVKGHKRLTIITASILDLSDEELKQYVSGCDAVASCLGHNLTFKGIFGKPRRLVTDATRRLCTAIRSNNPDAATKYVLMNTVANRNRDLNEPNPLSQRFIIWLLRLFLPPQPDNEQAAEYLRTQIGQDDKAIEWVAVRPSSLIDEDKPSEIEVYPSPTRSILKDGQISRINVGHFMADLITDDEIWQQWKGQMPAIYNKGTAYK